MATENITSYYASADQPGDDSTWSVYSEEYTESAYLEGDPIDGTQRLVESGFPSMQTAEARVSELCQAAKEAHDDAMKAQ